MSPESELFYRNLKEKEKKVIYKYVKRKKERNLRLNHI